MAYEIVLSPQAATDFKSLDARWRSAVKSALTQHLAHEPTKASKSRVKRLRGLRRPQYRLRVGETRVYYDVAERRVEILRILSKAASMNYLTNEGEAL